MPYIMLFFVGLTTLWAFFGQTLFGSFLPFAKTNGGWLVGLLVLSIGTIILLTFMNAIEENAFSSMAFMKVRRMIVPMDRTKSPTSQPPFVLANGRKLPKSVWPKKAQRVVKPTKNSMM